MNNKQIYTIIGAFLLMSTNGVFAQTCSTDDIKVLDNNCSKRDKGGSPSAHCTASVTAPKGHFFLKSDLKFSTEGTTYGDPAKYNYIPYKSVSANPILKGNTLQSASITSFCSRSGNPIKLGQTCYAKAKLSTKAYPHNCLKIKLQELVDKL